MTGKAAPLGLTALSVNGRIHTHGAPTSYFFEYGPTTAYGSKTSVKSVAPKLAAFYRESWTTGLGAWRGGAGEDLVFDPAGFARYSEPSGIDYNHVDGIGLLHLAQYFYPGIFSADAPSAALGGTEPDLRDAKVKVRLRGNAWSPRGSELLWWIQADSTHGKPPPDRDPTFSNWAHTGHVLTDALASGNWETVEYRLENDTNAWTFAGGNVELARAEYAYAPLDDALRRVDIDFFHMLAFVDDYDSPSGSIDFDDLQLSYRNHSLLIPSNGGRLVSSPFSFDDPAALTDGWRNGPGKMWKSGQEPEKPQEIVYAFDRPVTIDRLQIHQHDQWPSKNVEILTTQDGSNWQKLFTGILPESGSAGPGFAYLLLTEVDTCAIGMKLRVLDGYKTGYWGLGEIEAFGSGAVMETDDDWYAVNADLTGFTAGATVHHRLVATSSGRTVRGPDVALQLPADATPRVETGLATRIAGATAKVEGRVNSLGREAQVYFEYGPDTSYGLETTWRRTGPEITPRTVVATVADLTPGSTVHYRLVVTGPGGTSRGADGSFVAR